MPSQHEGKSDAGSSVVGTMVAVVVAILVDRKGNLGWLRKALNKIQL